MNKAIIFAGVDKGQESYQLLVGTKYITKRETSIQRDTRGLALEASKTFAERIFNESQMNELTYEIFIGNGKKLEVIPTEKPKVRDIEKLSKIEMDIFRTNFSKNLTNLTQNYGMVIDLREGLN